RRDLQRPRRPPPGGDRRQHLQHDRMRRGAWSEERGAWSEERGATQSRDRWSRSESKGEAWKRGSVKLKDTRHGTRNTGHGTRDSIDEPRRRITNRAHGTAGEPGGH